MQSTPEEANELIKKRDLLFEIANEAKEATIRLERMCTLLSELYGTDKNRSLYSKIHGRVLINFLAFFAGFLSGVKNGSEERFFQINEQIRDILFKR